MIWQLENWFFELGRTKSVVLGVVVSFILTVAATTTFGSEGVIISVLICFPFLLWLAISIMLVSFSVYIRRRILRHYTNALFGVFERLFSSYGLFCLGWYYTIWLVGWYLTET
jgi:uncharacterized membrane protein